MDALGIELRKDCWTVAHVRAGLLEIKARCNFFLKGDTCERLTGLKKYICGRGLEGAAVGIVLPPGFTVSRAIEIPAPKRSSIAGILRFEIEKHLPFDPAMSYFAFEVIGKRDKNLFSVIISAAEKDRLGRILDEFSTAGIGVDFAGAPQASLINALYHQKRKGAWQGKIAVIGRDADTVALDLFSGLAPVYSRTVFIDKKGRWAQGIERELRFYLCSVKASPEKKSFEEVMVISGDDGRSDFLDALKDHFNPRTSPGLHKVFRSLPPEIVAFGAALSALKRGRLGLNLVPCVKKKAPERRKTVALGAAVSILFASTGASHIARDWVDLRRVESALSEANSRKERMRGLADGLKSVDRRIKALEEIRGGPGCLEILRELSELLPSDTWLSGLEYSGGVLVMEGYAKRASSLLLKMETSGVLRDSEFAGPVTKGPEGRERFRIRSALRDRHGAGDAGDKVWNAGKGP